MPSTNRWRLNVKVDGTAWSDDAHQIISSFLWCESINEPPTGALVVDTDDRTKDALKVEDCIGKEIEVTLTNPEDGSETVFKGEVHAAEQAGRYEGKGTWTLVFRHKVYRLTQQAQCKMWMSGDYGENKSSDVVKQVISSAGLSAKAVDSSEISRASFLQYRETDFNFLQRLVEDMGMWLVFAHDASGDVSVTKSATATKDISEHDLIEWTVSSATTPNAIGMRTPPNPKENRVGGADESERLGSSPGKDAFGELRVGEYDASAENKANAKIHAKSMLYSLGADALRLSGAAIDTPLFAGDAIKVSGGPIDGGTALADTFLVTEAEVRYDASGVETQFTALQKHEQVLPPRKAIRPRIDGVAVAVVTTSEGDTMEQGRVKVMFPWLSEQVNSPWMRIAQPWAGKDRGAWFLPRVDDEVLVAFEQGDPDRPFIVGSLHNSKDTTPVPLPAEWEKSIIRTSKDHRLVFEDKDGEEFVEIQTGLNQHKIRLDDKDEFVEIQTGLKQHKIRLDDKDEFVEVVTGGGHALKLDDMGKKIELKSSGGAELVMDDNSQTITIKVGGNKIEMAPAGITIKAMKIDVKADTMAEVSGSAMLTLKGGMTKIN